MERPDDITPEDWHRTSSYRLAQLSAALDDLWSAIRAAITHR